MDELDHLGWVVTQSYEIGPYVVGIRTNSEAFARWLEHTLGEYATSEEADPYYSLLVAEHDDGRPGKRFNILYRESTALAKDLDLAVVVRTLVAELEGFLFQQRNDAVYAQAGVVAADGRTALVPSLLVPYLATLGRRLERSGLTLPVASQVAIDPASGLVVPVKPLLETAPDALERLRALAPTEGRDNRLVVERPTAVDAVCSIGLDEEPVQAVSAAYAVFRLVEKVVNLEKLGTTAVEAVGRLVENARCYELRTANVEGTRDALLTALSGAAPTGA